MRKSISSILKQSRMSILSLIIISVFVIGGGGVHQQSL
jgi:hypothetical protein